jgi:hypothetical protein
MSQLTMRQQKQPVALLFFADEDKGRGLYWTAIEGAEGLDENGVRHMKAFYALLQKWYLEKEYTSVLFLREDYGK